MRAKIERLEWIQLYEACLYTVELLCHGRSERVVWNALIRRTIRFHKHSETITTKNLIEGWSKYQLGPLLLGRTSVYNARKSLDSRNMIMWDTKCQVYAVNTPGLIKIFGTMWPNESSEWAVMLRHAEEEFDYEMDDIILGEKTMADLNEMHAFGVEKSKAGRERYKARKAAKGFNANMIVPLMAEYCEEFNETFHDEWTGKDRGCAKNWIKYCKESDKDPKEVLHDICRLWHRFRVGLKRDDGVDIVLPETVSFSRFFNHHKLIGSWIELHKEDKNAGWTEIGRIKRDKVHVGVPLDIKF